MMSNEQHQENSKRKVPTTIEIQGARVHNLKNIDVSIPLGQLVGIAGVSGSGKSSLALGVLYAEGSRRYLESLSTFTRRRISQVGKAAVERVEHIPAAVALPQRPSIPSIRSTFGTATELLNHLRLMFSRLGSHACPQGHMLEPSMAVALGQKLHCPVCHSVFDGPSAESFSFNSEGACATCHGTGIVREIDESTFVPDPTLTINQGAVESWNMFGISWMSKVAAEFGVRTDVPFQDLTAEEKEIVYHGAEIKKLVLIPSKGGKLFELNATYRNARRAVEEALKGATTEKGLDRINKYLRTGICPDCHGTRYSAKALSSLLNGKNLAEVSELTLDELLIWCRDLPATLPPELQAVATDLVKELTGVAQRLIELGVGYLSLERSAATLSTGERQRMQLARAVRNRTTGMLYVLDEPSIGLHPANVTGLLGVMHDLISDGNSVVFVDHDLQVLREADYLIEMGPAAGNKGGQVVATGAVAAIENNKASVIGPYISGKESVMVRTQVPKDSMFALGTIALSTDWLHTVQPLEVKIPCGRLVVVTGVSGSGKTTLVLEELLPALTAQIAGKSLPAGVKSLSNDVIRKVNVLDAAPIGINVRSTIATYTGILDDLRKLFAALPEAKAQGYKAADFSYNTGSLRCKTCDGTGQIAMDMQFLPDVDVVCPDCHGSRYGKALDNLRYQVKPSTTAVVVTATAAAPVAIAPESAATATAAANAAASTVATAKSEAEAAVALAPVEAKAQSIAKSKAKKKAKGQAELQAAAVSTSQSELEPDAGYTLPEILGLTIEQALAVFSGKQKVHRKIFEKLQLLERLGLGYLTLGEATPSLSGGEAQRLKLAAEMDKPQHDALFIFDEPSIGLHPRDIRLLLHILDQLVNSGATVLVIEHDLDIIANADFVIDLGPGGGSAGGRIVAAGTPLEIAASKESVTGQYLKEVLAHTATEGIEG